MYSIHLVLRVLREGESVLISVENVSYSTESDDGRILLRSVSCSVSQGEISALVGVNGSGKSTLARLLCAQYLPSAGSIVVDGHNAQDGPAKRLIVRRLVGLVQQDPADQIVSTNVFDEVAFGPRNLGLDEAEVARRVRKSLARVSLLGFDEREVTELSGGELQRLAIAGVLAMEPAYIIFDESSSQLDACLRADFRALLDSLAHEDGIGIVLLTHDPAEIFLADHVLLMSAGSLIWHGKPSRFCCLPRAYTDPVLADGALTSVFRVLAEIYGSNAPYKRPDLLSEWLKSVPSSFKARLESALLSVLHSTPEADISASGAYADLLRSPASLELQDVCFSYDDAAGDEDLVLDHVTLRVDPGEVLLIAGRSGSGKSTLALLCAGLLKPMCGAVNIHGAPAAPDSCSIAFQRPEDQLFLPSVGEELSFAPRNAGVHDGEKLARRVSTVSALMRLDSEILERSPFELSGGQQRRVGLACALSSARPVVVLDEPTAGLDAQGRRLIHSVVRSLSDAGTSVVVISHDIEEWLRVADSVALLEHGSVVWNGGAREVLLHPQILARAGLRPGVGLTLLSMAAQRNVRALAAGGDRRDFKGPTGFVDR